MKYRIDRLLDGTYEIVENWSPPHDHTNEIDVIEDLFIRGVNLKEMPLIYNNDDV